MQQVLMEKVMEKNKKLREENKLLKRAINSSENYKLEYLMKRLREALNALTQGKYYTREKLGFSNWKSGSS